MQSELNEERAGDKDLGNITATKEADLFEVLLRKTLTDLNRLSDELGDPSLAWLAKEKTIAKTRELFNLLRNSLDEKAEEDIKILNLSGMTGYAYWVQVRGILQALVARKKMWARYDQKEIAIAKILQDVKFDSEFDVDRFKELFIAEASGQMAKLSKQLQPAMRLRTEFKSLNNDFQSLISTIREPRIYGKRLIEMLQEGISSYFSDEVQTDIWTDVIRQIEEKKLHEKKPIQKKIDLEVKIVAKTKDRT